MTKSKYDYLIVGAGLAGASAAAGIREVDGRGSILLVGNEAELPYHRPPLSKQLWTGKKKVADIFVHDAAYYRDQAIELLPATTIAAIDPRDKTAATGSGERIGWGRLLLATGGRPRQLALPGLAAGDIGTFRTLDDYLALRSRLREGSSVAIIGGGFIGLEMAAALVAERARVTMIFPDPFPLARLLPAALASAILDLYRAKGVTVFPGDSPATVEKRDGRIVVHAKSGRSIEADLALAGIGLVPAIELAQAAGLQTANGIVVDERLQTSAADIYAAGDNALFFSPDLGRQMRVEHWDNAAIQGRSAGRNMAGAAEPYTHLPYFYSDLFEFGFEAVGEIDAGLTTVTDWKKENDTGVVYYLRDDRLRGVLLCNVWDKVETARQLIRAREKLSPAALEGAIA